MATIKIEVVAGANTYTKTKTITNAQATRFIAAYRVLYGQFQGPAVGDPPVLPAPRPYTDAEVADMWIDGLIAGTMGNIKNVESSIAAKTASDAIVIIIPT